MKSSRAEFRVFLAAVIAALVLACAWDPWIPGERNWNPDIVVDPSELSKDLALGVTYVDTLDCYSSSCEKRFRLVVDQPGQLTVIAIPELNGPDAQARIVLEGFQGVLARAASTRGPHEDVTVLTASATVDPGMYFVLIQSIGGRMPYQLTAHLSPGEGAAVSRAAETAPPTRTPPSNPPPRLVQVEMSGNARGAYDPAVAFANLHTFGFRSAGGFDPSASAGTSVETPVDRQIRRFLAADMTLRGFEQVPGERADMIVDFSRSSHNRSIDYPFEWVYDLYDFGALQWERSSVQTSGVLRVDIIASASDRIAWHAQTTKSFGPTAVLGEQSTELVRASVSEVLAGFPPR